MSLVKQHTLVFITRAVMPQNELAHTSIPGHHGSLTSSRMIVFLGHQQVVFSICTLMIKRRHSFQLLIQFWHVAGIATIGITAWSLCRTHQPTIRDHRSVRHDPVCTVFNIQNLRGRYLVEVNHVASDMRQQRFFPEQESTRRQPMSQRNGLHCQRSILIDDFLTRSINRAKHHFIA